MLLEAHAGRSLTLDEDARLRALAAEDPARCAALADFDSLHVAFDAERRLFEEVSAPLSPAEEMDEGYARLARAAAVAEDGLRAQLRFGDAARMRSEGSAVRRRRATWIGVLAAAAAVAVVVILVWRGAAQPKLLTGEPDGTSLGGASRILMQSELRADRPVLTWHSLLGAARYDARISDARGELVLARPDADAASTTWELSSNQFAELRARASRVPPQELRLRIVARDGAGIAVGTTGELPLRLVD